MTNWSESELWSRFKEFNRDFLFWHFQAANGRPFSTLSFLLERERIDREREAELAILDWKVSLCEVQETVGNMFLVENPMGATSWNQPSILRLRNAPVMFEDISHLCMFGGQGSEEAQRPQETRQVLDKQSRAVEICRFEVSEGTCSRTGARTDECVSDFVSLAHACLDTSSDSGSGE